MNGRMNEDRGVGRVYMRFFGMTMIPPARLLLGEAVHQLAGLVSCFEMLAVLAYFIDMHLLEVSIAGAKR